MDAVNMFSHSAPVANPSQAFGMIRGTRGGMRFLGLAAEPVSWRFVPRGTGNAGHGTTAAADLFRPRIGVRFRAVSNRA
jgi:hypothetical protein